MRKSQYRAVIQGSQGDASRLGTKLTGMIAHVQSWSGQVNVRMWYRTGDAHHDDGDWVRITLSPHGHASDRDPCVCLYEGPCDGWHANLAMRAVQIENKQFVDQSERDRRRIAKLTRDNHVTTGVNE